MDEPESRRPRQGGAASAMTDQPAGPEKPLARAADAASTPRPPIASPRAFPWLGTGIRLFILLLVGGLVVVVAREWDWWVGSAVRQATDGAYLQADLTPLAAKGPGYGPPVPVQDFQKVKAGDLLVGIVDDDYRAQLDQAQANVATAQAAIENIEQQKLLQQAMIKQAEATIHASEADLTRYHLEALRQKTLLTQGLAGTRQLTEQAVDNENAPRPRSTSTGRSSSSSANRSMCWTAKGNRPRRRSRRNRRHAISPRSTSATPASPRRSTAWSVSDRSGPASMSASGRRSSRPCPCPMSGFSPTTSTPR